MKVSVFGEFNASMLYLLLTIFNGINELKLCPNESCTNLEEDVSQFSKVSKAFSFKRLVLDKNSVSHLQIFFDRALNLEFLGLQELSLC